MEAVDHPKRPPAKFHSLKRGKHELKTWRQACFHFSLHKQLRRGLVGAAAGADDERGDPSSHVARACDRQLRRLTPLHLQRAFVSSRPCVFQVCAKASGATVTDVADIGLRAKMPFVGISCSDARSGLVGCADGANILFHCNAARAFVSFLS